MKKVLLADMYMDAMQYSEGNIEKGYKEKAMARRHKAEEAES